MTKQLRKLYPIVCSSRVETMTADERLSKSLNSITAYLRDSLQALSRNDEDSFDSSLWQAAAELEYALFLFSMKFQDESIASKWKPKPALKKADATELMAEARNLLSEAEKGGNEQLLDAYRSAYVARHYLLRVQEDLAKKKRQALKKK